MRSVGARAARGRWLAADCGLRRDRAPRGPTPQGLEGSHSPGASSIRFDGPALRPTAAATLMPELTGSSLGMPALAFQRGRAQVHTVCTLLCEHVYMAARVVGH